MFSFSLVILDSFSSYGKLLHDFYIVSKINFYYFIEIFSQKGRDVSPKCFCFVSEMWSVCDFFFFQLKNRKGLRNEAWER